MSFEPLARDQVDQLDTDEPERLSQNAQMLGIAVFGGLLLVGFFFGIVTGYDTPKPVIIVKKEKEPAKEAPKPEAPKPAPKTVTPEPEKKDEPRTEKKDDPQPEKKEDPKPPVKKDEFSKDVPQLDAGAVFQNVPANFKQVVESPQKYDAQFFVFEGQFAAPGGDLKRNKDTGLHTLAFQSQGKPVPSGELDKDRLSFVVADDVAAQIEGLKAPAKAVRVFCQVRFAKPQSKTYPIAFVFRLELFDTATSGVASAVVPAKSPQPKVNPAFKPAEPKKEDTVVAKAVSFEKDVKPILRTYCFNCHGAAGKPKGDVDLTSLAKITAKGAPDILKPGDPKKSAIFTTIEDQSMPPNGARPGKGETEVIKNWILGGAKP